MVGVMVPNGEPILVRKRGGMGSDEATIPLPTAGQIPARVSQSP